MPHEGEQPVTAVERPATDGSGMTAKRREPLSRERVIAAALKVMDEEGAEAVTMRRVGRELGVEAMSLYNHVRDKEDLLDGITELVLSEFRFESTGGDWMEDARAASHGWRRILRAHPNVVRLLVERKHPMTSAESLWPVEVALQILRRAGLTQDDAIHAFHSFGGYIFGSVLMEVAHVSPVHPQADPVDAAYELRRMLPADRFPQLSELLPALLGCDDEETFDFGLDLLLEGLRAKAARG